MYCFEYQFAAELSKQAKLKCHPYFVRIDYEMLVYFLIISFNMLDWTNHFKGLLVSL